MLGLDKMVFILTSPVRFSSACSSAAVYEQMDSQNISELRAYTSQSRIK